MEKKVKSTGREEEEGGEKRSEEKKKKNFGQLHMNISHLWLIQN